MFSRNKRSSSSGQRDDGRSRLSLSTSFDRGHSPVTSSLRVESSSEYGYRLHGSASTTSSMAIAASSRPFESLTSQSHRMSVESLKRQKISGLSSTTKTNASPSETQPTIVTNNPNMLVETVMLGFPEHVENVVSILGANPQVFAGIQSEWAYLFCNQKIYLWSTNDKEDSYRVLDVTGRIKMDSEISIFVHGRLSKSRDRYSTEQIKFPDLFLTCSGQYEVYFWGGQTMETQIRIPPTRLKLPLQENEGIATSTHVGSSVFCATSQGRIWCIQRDDGLALKARCLQEEVSFMDGITKSLGSMFRAPNVTMLSPITSMVVCAQESGASFELYVLMGDTLQKWAIENARGKPDSVVWKKPLSPLLREYAQTQVQNDNISDDTEFTIHSIHSLLNGSVLLVASFFCSLTTQMAWLVVELSCASGEGRLRNQPKLRRHSIWYKSSEMDGFDEKDLRKFSVVVCPKTTGDDHSDVIVYLVWCQHHPNAVVAAMLMTATIHNSNKENEADTGTGQVMLLPTISKEICGFGHGHFYEDMSLYYVALSAQRAIIRVSPRLLLEECNGSTEYGTSRDSFLHASGSKSKSISKSTNVDVPKKEVRPAGVDELMAILRDQIQGIDDNLRLVFDNSKSMDDLGVAITKLSETILNAKPATGARWGDKSASASISPQLVKYHLEEKRRQFDEFIHFLEKHPDGIWRVENHFKATLQEHGEKLDSALALCHLQAQSGKVPSPDGMFQSKLSGEIIQKAMEAAVFLRGYTLKQLEYSGLTITDAFYAEVTRVEDFLPHLNRMVVDAHLINPENHENHHHYSSSSSSSSSNSSGALEQPQPQKQLQKQPPRRPVHALMERNLALCAVLEACGHARAQPRIRPPRSVVPAAGAVVAGAGAGGAGAGGAGAVGVVAAAMAAPALPSSSRAKGGRWTSAASFRQVLLDALTSTTAFFEYQDGKAVVFTNTGGGGGLLPVDVLRELYAQIRVMGRFLLSVYKEEISSLPSSLPSSSTSPSRSTTLAGGRRGMDESSEYEYVKSVVLNPMIAAGDELTREAMELCEEFLYFPGLVELCLREDKGHVFSLDLPLGGTGMQKLEEYCSHIDGFAEYLFAWYTGDTINPWVDPIVPRRIQLARIIEQASKKDSCLKAFVQKHPDYQKYAWLVDAGGDSTAWTSNLLRDAVAEKGSFALKKTLLSLARIGSCVELSPEENLDMVLKDELIAITIQESLQSMNETDSVISPLTLDALFEECMASTLRCEAETSKVSRFLLAVEVCELLYRKVESQEHVLSRIIMLWSYALKCDESLWQELSDMKQGASDESVEVLLRKTVLYDILSSYKSGIQEGTLHGEAMLTEDLLPPVLNMCSNTIFSAQNHSFVAKCLNLAVR